MALRVTLPADPDLDLTEERGELLDINEIAALATVQLEPQYCARGDDGLREVPLDMLCDCLQEDIAAHAENSEDPCLCDCHHPDDCD